MGLLGGAGRGCQLGAQGAVDPGQLGFGRPLGGVVLHQIAVQQDEQDDVDDGAEQPEHRPDDGVAEVRRHVSEDAEVRPHAFELRPQRVGLAAGLGPLPRRRGRGIEELEASSVVVT